MSITEHERADEFELRTVRSVSDGHQVRVLVAGELDVYSSPQLRRLLAELCNRKAPAIVVDLGRVSFCDGQGIRVLVGATREARRRGGSVRLHHPSRFVRRLVRVLQLEMQLDLAPEPAP